MVTDTLILKGKAEVAAIPYNFSLNYTSCNSVMLFFQITVLELGTDLRFFYADLRSNLKASNMLNLICYENFKNKVSPVKPNREII